MTGLQIARSKARRSIQLQKGGVPATPSGTATLLRLSPNHRFHPRPTLAVTDFRRPRLSWLDGRCVQGPIYGKGLELAKKAIATLKDAKGKITLLTDELGKLAETTFEVEGDD